jgi:hypothetical protein
MRRRLAVGQCDVFPWHRFDDRLGGKHLNAHHSGRHAAVQRAQIAAKQPPEESIAILTQRFDGRPLFRAENDAVEHVAIGSEPLGLCIDAQAFYNNVVIAMAEHHQPAGVTSVQQEELESGRHACSSADRVVSLTVVLVLRTGWSRF